MTNKSLLFFKLREVCYDSYLYFADSLMHELAALGYAITCFDNTKPLEQIEQFSGCHFDGIFDFNSNLPRIMTDSDEYFLDTIDGPFYDVILDHPLYHHDSLKIPLKDYHVICLDENHQHYIETNYPHIQSVDVLQMTGSGLSTPPAPLAARKFDVLFTGTYTPLSEIIDVIDRSPVFLRDNIHRLIDCMKRDPGLTMEDALTRLAIDTKDEVILENFPLHMQAYFTVDSYLRAYYRQEVIRTLLDADIPILVCGHGWEDFSCRGIKNLQIGGSFAFQDTFRIMERSRILLNVMPLFKAGSHDRIYSSMLNGCVTVTDLSEWLTREFQDELVTYDLAHLDALPGLITDLLSDPQKMQEIAASGYTTATSCHTWKNRAKALSLILDSH